MQVPYRHEHASIASDVTVAIPAKNTERTLAECLRTVFDMKPAPGHVIVLNDHSTDNTAPIARELGATVVDIKGQGGLGNSRNTGIALCETRYVAFINADCYPNPDWLVTSLKIIRASGAAVVGGRQVELRDSTLAERWKASHLRQDLGPQPVSDPDYLSGGNLLIDLSLIGEIRFGGGYKIAYEDVDFCRKLRAAGGSLYYEPQAVIGHDHKETLRSLPAKVWSYGVFSRSVGPVSGRRDAIRAFIQMHRRPHDQVRQAFVDDVRNRRALFTLVDLYLFLGSLWLFLTRTPDNSNYRVPAASS